MTTGRRWLPVVIGLASLLRGCGCGKPNNGPPADSGTEEDADAGSDGDAQPAQVCGNGICEPGESAQDCPRDCCSELYEIEESDCIAKGWRRETIEVDGLPRKILWKGPPTWQNGAIVVLHGLDL
jgi:hypothetical protein